MTTTLYKIDANDQIRTWSIISEQDTVIITHGQLNGKQTVATEQITTNQSGRSLDQQIALEKQSRINKQLDKGYCYSIEEATNSKGLNASKLLKPMLAQKFKDVKNIDYANCFVQYKYNGHRCLVTKQNGVLIAYSRNGKPINSIAHILKDLQWLPEGHTLDGELYVHGLALQAISSIVRKDQADSKKLIYVVYDILNHNAAYVSRNQWLRVSPLGNASRVIIIAPTFKFTESQMPLKDRLVESINSGYEGLILRHGNTGYEAGKRSQSLVKVKQVLDAEFCIVGVSQSADGWAVFECYKVPNVLAYISNNATFKVSAPGTMQEKHDAWANRNALVGKMLTVEFFEWTIEGKPFHPVAIGVRDDE